MAAIHDLIDQIGEPVFPAPLPVAPVANRPTDVPWHTLIEADNCHALQLLEFLCAGQVDRICIDPACNTGARNWKYDDDVDGDDAWRHGKSLSTVQRLLPISKPAQLDAIFSE